MGSKDWQVTLGYIPPTDFMQTFFESFIPLTELREDHRNKEEKLSKIIYMNCIFLYIQFFSSFSKAEVVLYSIMQQKYCIAL